MMNNLLFQCCRFRFNLLDPSARYIKIKSQKQSNGKPKSEQNANVSVLSCKFPRNYYTNGARGF